MSKGKRLNESDAELFDIIMRYRHENFDKPFEIPHVAAWAIRSKLWKVPARSLVRELKKELRFCKILEIMLFL